MVTYSAAYRMVHYMAWANHVTLQNAAQLSEEELHASRDTLFKTIAGTFDHILVIQEIFLAHLQGTKHNFTGRSRTTPLPFNDVAHRLRELDQHYIELAAHWSQDDLEEIIPFEFVDGGTGAMSREDILLHLANHSTYHRGFISTLMYPHHINSAASDLSVFLRDIWPIVKTIDTPYQRYQAIINQ